MDISNIDGILADVMSINGAIATSLIDWQSGMVLGTAGGSADFNIELASAGNSDVIKAKMETMKSLGLAGGIQDILITLTDQIHILKIVESNPELCLYAAFTDKANLAMARHKLQSVSA